MKHTFLEFADEKEKEVKPDEAQTLLFNLMKAISSGVFSGHNPYTVPEMKAAVKFYEKVTGKDY